MNKIPATFILDAKGKVVKQYIGYQSQILKDLRDIVGKMIASEPASELCTAIKPPSLLLRKEPLRPVAIIRIDSQKAKPQDVHDLTSTLRSQISASGHFTLISEDAQRQAITAQNKSFDKCTDSACHLQLGRSLSASWMLHGELNVAHDQLYRLNLKWIDLVKGSEKPVFEIQKQGEVFSDFMARTIHSMFAQIPQLAQSAQPIVTGERGTLYIDNSGISDVTLRISGDPRLYPLPNDSGSRSFDLHPGSYELTFSKPEHLPYSEKHTLAKGEAKTIRVDPGKLRPAINQSNTQQSGQSTGVLDIVVSDKMTDQELRDVNVEIDGQKHPNKVTDTISGIPTGWRHITLRHPLYVPYAERVEIRRNDTKTLNVKLVPDFGNLEITSVPSGATVFLDNQQRGNTPLKISRIPSRAYQIRVQNNLYHTENFNLFVQRGEITKRHVNLKPAFGELLISSEPEGASVYVNEEHWGNTPIHKTEVASGEYRIRVQMETRKGFLPRADRVVVKDNERTQRMFQLQTNMAQVQFTSKPDNANILLNGQEIGRTPLTKEIEAGTYSVRYQIEDPPHRSHESKLVIRAGQDARHVGKLLPRQGAIMVISRPRGAEIYINGKPQGKTPRKFDRLFIGTYTVRLEMEGYRSTSKELTVTDDGFVAFEGHLKQGSQSDEPSSPVPSKLTPSVISTSPTQARRNPATIPAVIGSLLIVGGLIPMIYSATQVSTYNNVVSPESANELRNNIEISFYTGLAFTVVGMILVGTAVGLGVAHNKARQNHTAAANHLHNLQGNLVNSSTAKQAKTRLDSTLPLPPKDAKTFVIID
jgi:hypothetical protein